MTADTQVAPPSVSWAQRTGLVLLNIHLEDCKSPEINIQPEKIHFKGKGGSDNKLHEVTMDFYKDIIPEESKYLLKERIIEFCIKKKEDGPYWPHLLKDKRKQHWLKVDFHRWKDEDDSDDEAGPGGAQKDQDLEEMMRSMGGLNPDGAGGVPNMNDLDEDDSDDGDIPDLE